VGLPSLRRDAPPSLSLQWLREAVANSGAELPQTAAWASACMWCPAAACGRPQGSSGFCRCSVRLCSFSAVPERNYCCSAPLLQATSSPGSAMTSLMLTTAGAGCYCAFNFEAFIIRHMSNFQLKIPDALCIVLEYTEY
jgi:hypothetical protein